MRNFFYGNNVSVKAQVDKILADFSEKDPSLLNFHRFRGQVDLVSLSTAILSMPFLGEKKLILLENLISENDKKKIDDIVLLISKAPETSIIVWVETGTDLEKNVSIKKILASKVLDSKYFPPLIGFELSNWIKERAKVEQLTFAPPALSKLVALTNGNFERINAELDKIFLYTKAQKSELIEQESVELLIKSENSDTIFAFLEQIAKKNIKIASAILANLINSGENEIYIVSMLAYQFRTLYLILEQKDRGLSEAQMAKEIGIHPFVVKKNMAFLRYYSQKRLSQIIILLQEFEAKTKRGALDPSANIYLLIISLCR